MRIVPSIPDQLHFGSLKISPAVTLAPMAGVTDTVFRQFIRGLGGCGLIMTEFTSSHGIIANDKRKETGKQPKKSQAFNYLYFEETEHPIVAQLFGSDPKVLADAARIVEDNGFDGVDMNFGCPVKKVVKCNGGSGLLRDLPLIEEILTEIRGAVKIPFTCKFRTGWSDSEIVSAKVGRIAEDCGLQGVALHGRTREQGYAGNANWDHIAELKQAVNIPVLGNGDVFSPEDAVRMFEHTGCDGVMIGRAAASNPWIFRQIQQYIETGGYDEPTEDDRYRMIREYYVLLMEKADKISGGTTGKMKQFATYFTKSVRNGKELRRAIYHVHTQEEVLDTVDRFFEQQLAA